MFSFMQRNPVKSVSVNDIDSLIGKINLIDIREPYEYKEGHLPTARNIPMDNIISVPERYLDKSKDYYIICHSGSRSSVTSNILKKQGFNVINVSGGTGRYRGKLAR